MDELYPHMTTYIYNKLRRDNLTDVIDVLLNYGSPYHAYISYKIDKPLYDKWIALLEPFIGEFGVTEWQLRIVRREVIARLKKERNDNEF